MSNPVVKTSGAHPTPRRRDGDPRRARDQGAPVPPPHPADTVAPPAPSAEDVARQAFADAVRPSPPPVVRPERRRSRRTVEDIRRPRRQIDMGTVRIALRTLDASLVSVLIMVGVWSNYVGMNDNPVIAPLAAGLVGAVAFIAMLSVLQAHRFAPTESLGDHLRKVGLASLAALGLWLAAALIIRPETFQPTALAKAGLMAGAVMLALHAVYHSFLSRLHARGMLAPTIVMLGATPSARRLIEHNATTRELNILAIFDDRLKSAPHNIHGVPVVGRVNDLLDWDGLPYVDRIVVTLPGAAQERKRDFVEQVRLLPNRIAFVVDEFDGLDHIAQRVRQIASVRLREVTGEPKSGVYIFAKRVMDIVVASTALVLLAPVLAAIGVLIKLDSPGPVLFRQPREGFNNRLFDVWKFRSLRVETEDRDAASQVTAGDTRVTRIGRFIRKTSIDELPQLVNVVRGEMSLVGPRPHTPGMKTAGEDSRRLVAEYAHRHKVKPGMTGWAQINGSRGPMHKTDDLARRVALDVDYIENASLWWDVVIMAKTLPCLLGDSEVQR